MCWCGDLPLWNSYDNKMSQVEYMDRSIYLEQIESTVSLIKYFYTPVERSIMEWPCPSVGPSVRPFTIACERDILKTDCQINFTFWYGLNITKTSDAIDLGHSTETKMAATAVWRLTLYPIQNIACERDRLKTTHRIDFLFWYGLNTTTTLDAIDLGHSTKTKMAATAVCRLTLYPTQDIACERSRLKTACQINFTFWYDLNTLRPRMLLIWGILRKPRWPPQQFEDEHCNLYRILIATSK